jgi:hypothetical protein
MLPRSEPRRRAGRPPAGARPGEKVKDYPQVSLRIPPAFKSQLHAISVLRAKPQWRVLIDALELLVRELTVAEKRRLRRMARSKGWRRRARRR